MYKILKADKDAYITNRVINGDRTYSSNTGIASTLDLFKIVGLTFTGSIPNTELSRILIHFDLTDLRTLHSTNKIDISNPSFFCRLQLTDVYGGQPTPENFDVVINPLSASFTEGRGKDIVLYSDHDVCNFLSSSVGTPWILSGCFLGNTATSSCDYITDFSATQHFTGEENLVIDVTAIVSATIANIIPDNGFRIALSSAIEQNSQTYFVKRFASRQAYNTLKHPKLIFGFDDSVSDDTQNIAFDSTSTLFLYNYSLGNLANVVSGTTQISGSNSLILKLSTEISGGFYSLVFTGSQHSIGTVTYPGIYSASVFLPSSDAVINSKLLQSGSVDFTPIWTSFDDSITYLSGAVIHVNQSNRTSTHVDNSGIVVSVTNINSVHQQDENIVVDVNIFRNNVMIKASRLPIVLPSLVVRDVFYAIRCLETNELVIPFETDFGSTRVSSDASGMFFTLDMSNLETEKTYVVDIMLTSSGNHQKYLNASQVFKVTNLQ